MVCYKCELCNKIFNHKGNYLHHINRKKSCVIISPSKCAKNGTDVPEIAHSCKFCNKEYKRKSELNRHYKSCKNKLAQEKDSELKEELLSLLLEIKLDNKKTLEKQQEENKKMLNNQQKLYEKKIDQLQDQIKKQSDEMKKLKTSKITNKNNKINSNNNTINNTINLLTYNKTDTTHLTDKDYLNCIKHSNMMIPHLIDKIHFDEDKPENRNIYISNMRNNYVLVYEEGKWKMKNRDETINHLIDDKEIIIEEKLEDWKEKGKKYGEAYKKFEKYLEKKENDVVLNKIKEEIKLMLYNKRTMVENQTII